MDSPQREDYSMLAEAQESIVNFFRCTQNLKKSWYSISDNRNCLSLRASTCKTWWPMAASFPLTQEHLTGFSQTPLSNTWVDMKTSCGLQMRYVASLQKDISWPAPIDTFR